MKIYPSLISSDILNLAKVIGTLDKHCDGYHIDVMDDHFVPNLTWGPMFVQKIIEITPLPIHLHLMVEDPEKWIDRVRLRVDDIFIFHYEACKDKKNLIRFIQELKKRYVVGLAINPETGIESLDSYVSILDHVLIMSVKPGFSGQSFLPGMLQKVLELVKVRERLGLSFSIGMDGGIGCENISQIKDAGVDLVGVASAIFSKNDYLSALKKLYKS